MPTFLEVEEQMPNGLHDALLQSINLDFCKATCVMELMLLVGLPDDLPPESRYARRLARLTFEGLHSFVLEPPEDVLSDPEGLFIVGGALPYDKVAPPVSFSALPPDVFAIWIFSNDNNSFIYLAAREVTMQWK